MNILVGRRIILVLLTGGATLLGRGEAASGDYIATNVGQDGSFNTNKGYNLAGPEFFTGQGFDLAVAFHVGGKTPVTFGSASLAIAYRGGEEAMDVILAADDGGQPGKSLETIHLTDLPINGGFVTAVGSGETLLEPGETYWIVAVVADDTNITWYANDQGESGHFAYRSVVDSGRGRWASSPNAADPAFAVTSGDFTTAAAVPAPSSLSLLGIGLIGMIGRGAARRFRPA